MGMEKHRWSGRNRLKDKLREEIKDLKLEMKNVSLGTSKVNYIDPRITISFMKKQPTKAHIKS